MYASLIFHSRGISQSNAGVPDGTSVRMSGIRSATRSNVFLTPAPVMLRQSGYIARIIGHKFSTWTAHSASDLSVASITVSRPQPACDLCLSTCFLP